MSVFPIGLIGDWLVDSPVVKDGSIVGFHVVWIGNRKYPLDMAQFAVKVKTLKEVAEMNYAIITQIPMVLKSLSRFP